MTNNPKDAERLLLLIEALRSYQQADEDGVMVLVSRQACEEAANLLPRLTQERDTATRRVEALTAALKNIMRVGPRPWMAMGKVTWEEWETAYASAEAALHPTCVVAEPPRDR